MPPRWNFELHSRRYANERDGIRAQGWRGGCAQARMIDQA
jgi:hypothetical protein